MTIEFLKKEEGWVAEFEATADFNLHLEGVVEGNVNIYQRTTASGGYTLVRGATPYPSYGNVYDYDFASLVYPKFIKVVCPNEPSSAEVMSTGEVTELKYQEKSVDVIENGLTEVAPDAGFAGLAKVSVNVNVPTSGEGGGSSDGDLGEFIGFELYGTGLGDGYCDRYAFSRSSGSTWQECIEMDWFDSKGLFSIYEGAVCYRGQQLYHEMEDTGWWSGSFSNPVMAEDAVVSKTYFYEGGGIGM